MLAFNKTTEYAFRIMSHMAHDKERLYRSDDIYEELQIPFRYLRRILTLLSKKGLLNSIQGKHGGFSIKKELIDISLMDIVIAVEENKEKNECFFGFSNCPLTDKCSMHDKWKYAQEAINDVLKNTTLQEIKEKGKTNFKKMFKRN